MAHALSGPLAEHFVCGASPHPSMQLENTVFQRDTLALFGAVNKPLLLMAAKVRVLVCGSSRSFVCICGSP